MDRFWYVPISFQLKLHSAGCYGMQNGRVLRSRKVDIRLPGQGNSNSRGARPVYSFR